MPNLSNKITFKWVIYCYFSGYFLSLCYTFFMTKTLLVTSALPYANGDIHLGHLVEHVQTDVFVRFQKSIGNNCYYMCADDTHGTAIMLSAEKEGVAPEDYIQKVNQRHVADFNLFNIGYDEYYSTHSPENEAISSKIYLDAKSDGGIVTREIEQYFCEKTQLFLADRYIKGTCPNCGAENQYGDACEHCYSTYSATELIRPISVFSGLPPVLKKSTHYFFKLDRYESVITDWLDQNPVSEPVRNKLKEWFDQGLKDWDISRDAPYFGFKIPETNDKYFYVWMDAPIGYIATTEHWAKKRGESHTQYWNNDDVEIHHFIGKDIMYFHTLFWPAMLKVSGYNVPTKVNVHGFLTVNGEKMSKSRGTFILARDYAKHLDADILRYYYTSKLSSSLDDIDFNVEDFVTKVNSDVLGKFINIASRIGAIVTKKCDGLLTTIDDDGLDMIHQMLSYSDEISSLYEDLETNKCMRLIMQCADIANKYIDDKAPWALVKVDAIAAQRCCTAALNALRILMIYLGPVMPTITKQLADFLSIHPQSWSQLHDHLINSKIQPYQHILKRLVLEDVNAYFFTPS